MMENGWHSTMIRIRYKDTDRMGVVYYGNYLTFFEVGRAEYMRELGFPYSGLEDKGYSLVVVEAAVKYHANVGYDSMVIVKTSITDLRRVRVRFDYEIVSEENILLVKGHTVHACINSDLKPAKIPSGMMESMKERIIEGRP
ncbi:acyl-CoA thioesterase [Thermodesulfobacteriota bacterium]